MDINTLAFVTFIGTSVCVALIACVWFVLKGRRCEVGRSVFCCPMASGPACGQDNSGPTSCRTQDLIFRRGAECQVDVAVVFIDRQDCQQLNLTNVRRGRVGVISTPPPQESGPPPYYV